MCKRCSGRLKKLSMLYLCGTAMMPPSLLAEITRSSRHNPDGYGRLMTRSSRGRARGGAASCRVVSRAECCKKVIQKQRAPEALQKNRPLLKQG